MSVSVPSWLFWLVPACSGVLGLVTGGSGFYKRRLHGTFWLENLRKMDFILDFIKKWGALTNYKVGRVILQNGTTLMYKKLCQVILQSTAGILHYRGIYFTKWGKYCKAGQPLLHSGVVITKWGNYFKAWLYKIEKQALSSVSCTENCFIKLLQNF